ncbi:hypothetical protein GGR56DRAFT_672006 [Xylariaceae sp. FL0804]|nr:hypothetical protein GGR56DRAFT_672006 [Xylariaceae sp. FL0804]
MDAHKSQRLQTVDDLLSGYGSLSVPQLMRCLAPDFRHQVLPASLAMAPHDRAAFAKHAAGIFGVFDEFSMVPCTTIDGGGRGGDADAAGEEEEQEEPVVMVHAQMRGRLKKDAAAAAGAAGRDGDGDGGETWWENECVMMIRLTADATLVREVVEFVDSAKAIEMARSHAPKDF